MCNFYYGIMNIVRKDVIDLNDTEILALLLTILFIIPIIIVIPLIYKIILFIADEWENMIYNIKEKFKKNK